MGSRFSAHSWKYNGCVFVCVCWCYPNETYEIILGTVSTILRAGLCMAHWWLLVKVPQPPSVWKIEVSVCKIVFSRIYYHSIFQVINRYGNGFTYIIAAVCIKLPRFYLTRACVAWKRNPGSEMKFSQLAPLLSLLLRTYGDPELCCHFQEDCAGVGNLTHGVRLWHLQAGKRDVFWLCFKFFPNHFQYNSKNKLFPSLNKINWDDFRIQGDLQPFYGLAQTVWVLGMPTGSDLLECGCLNTHSGRVLVWVKIYMNIIDVTKSKTWKKICTETNLCRPYCCNIKVWWFASYSSMCRSCMSEYNSSIND